MAILSFLGNINIALRKITDAYPGCRLYEVDATADDGQPTTDMKQFTKIRVVARGPPGEASHVTILSKPAILWGEWEEPVYARGAWLEDIVIPWPVKFGLPDAYQVIVDAGFTEPIGTLNLRWPLTWPANKEPFYIFGIGMPPTEFVFVGAYTHKLHGNVNTLGHATEEDAFDQEL